MDKKAKKIVHSSSSLFLFFINLKSFFEQCENVNIKIKNKILIIIIDEYL